MNNFWVVKLLLCVYSNKVDFFSRRVLKPLDMIRSKEGEKGEDDEGEGEAMSLARDI